MPTKIPGRFVALIAILSAFPPIATDMYLPAIPTMQIEWSQPLHIINLTLISFLVVYCLSLLIYGPLSDRFGRKPPLIGGISLYVFACFLCAVAGSVYHLIFYRILQAAGAASAAAIAMAIIKDRIPGAGREKLMAQVGVITALAPMLAPTLGGLLMTHLSWPWIFIGQAVLGIISLVCVIFMEEPMARESLSRSPWIRRYAGVLKNRRFIFLIFIVALIGAPSFAFIAVSSDIYITGIGVSETCYGILFGANAVCFMLGTFICSKISPIVGSMRLMSISFFGIFCGGVLMVFSPFPGVWRLFIPMAVIAVSMGLGRPPSNNIALEQVEQDTGTASSVLIFSYFIIGAIGMWIVSLDWQDKIHVIGLIGLATGGFCSISWKLLKPHLRLPVLDNALEDAK